MSQAKTCPRLPSCELYARFKVQSLFEVWKINYCEAAFESCERYKRASLGERVPLTLLPNGQQLRLPVRPSSS